MKKSTKLITTIIAIGAGASAIAPIALSSCSNKCTITFEHTTGGTIRGERQITVKSGTTWGKIENKPQVVPNKALGYTFDGWKIGSDPIKDDTEIKESVVIRATFKQTVTQYNVSIEEIAGISFEVVEKTVGKNIVISYSNMSIYDIESVSVTVGSATFSADLDEENNKIIIDHNEITDATETIYVSITVTTAVRYSLALLKDPGFSKFEVVQNEIGEDLILTYEFKDEFHKFDSLLVKTNDGTVITPIHDPATKTITITDANIPYGTIAIIVKLNSDWNVESYTLDIQKDTGFASLQETTIEYGEDIVLTYSLQNEYLIDSITVQEEDQQSPIEDVVIDKDNKTITIDHTKVENPTKTITVIATTEKFVPITFEIAQSEKIKFAQYEGTTKDKVVTYNFIPKGIKLRKGDVVKAEFNGQTHNPTPDEREGEVKQIGFYKNLDTYNVEEDGITSVPFKFVSTYKGTDTDLFEVQFNLKFTVTRGSEYTFESEIKDIFYENGIATTANMFVYDSKDITKIVGIKEDDERWKNPDYNVLVVPKHVTSISIRSSSDLSTIRWLILDETWGGILDPDGCDLSVIGQSAFQSAGGFRGELYIPSSVTEIKAGAFNKASGFTGCDLVFGSDSKIKTIMASSFSESGLGGKTPELVLPEGLETLGQTAFWKCNFESVVFPASLTRFDKDASGSYYGCFYENAKLAEIDVSAYDAVPSYDNWGNDGSQSTRGDAATFAGTAANGIVWIKKDDAEFVAAWKALLEKIGLSSSWEYKVHGQ